ncbi:glycosyltransferase family A protein [Vibrio sp. TH_r3]|uniref:glycosyltransferase family 2 protein n=1 Tax=Vibrio sp. TH_r3 TaxID=3082084 RepID=UPI002954F4B2|nr:glycosyltransferase family A protein [Vibrio sp. TH_r3]MDV7102880.1 glycosyltransferase family A protein [Vibrio sp. TH_r3]
MKNPLISIVINNYNYQEYVAKALNSALEQDYANVEVVIVDDGSTDKSAEIIRSFNLEKAVFQTNAGQISAMNAGFNLSSGEVVIFLDSDDYLYPECCSEIAKCFKENIMAYQYKLDTVRADETKMNIDAPPCDLLLDKHQDFIYKHGYIPSAPMSGMAYSRQYLQSVLPADPSIWQSAYDGYLIYVAAATGDVVSINRCLGAYRQHNKSESEHGNTSMRKHRHMLDCQILYAKGIKKRAFQVSSLSLQLDNLLGAYHWKRRLDSYLLDRSNHRYSTDNKFFLAKNMFKAFYHDPLIDSKRKTKNLFLSLLYMLAPTKLSVYLSGKLSDYPDLKSGKI